MGDVASPSLGIAHFARIVFHRISLTPTIRALFIMCSAPRHVPSSFRSAQDRRRKSRAGL